MNFEGIIISALALAIIGLYHPLVIKGEYYFSERIWPLFLVLGLLGLGASLFLQGLWSPVAALIGALNLWSIHELKQQTQRVRKGWFPKNPNRRWGPKD